MSADAELQKRPLAAMGKTQAKHVAVEKPRRRDDEASATAACA
eukprot:CAMPEP_0198661906 /NCGR_PEP_ID=MMETSP1467-20131203/44835_1 /TAXON_ID=1462469 /ORGANISM="unid. sp., Strain CCMP2135" /LENGTH=42 /DNA_ID= /DNA_START= /DNA_END= /DNA_ORIENTATION=